MTMDRREIEALLPFLANGTLRGAEKEEVEAALAEDAGLQTEFAALRAIRLQMQSEEVEASPGELGLARLMRDIDREGRAQAGSRSASDNVVPLSRLRIWQVAAVLVLAVGVAQNVAFQRPGMVPEFAPDPGEQVAPAASERAVPVEDSAVPTRGLELANGAPGAAAAAAFRVTFSPAATEAEIRAFLIDARLEIVGGPSALGFYELALLDGAEGFAAARAALDAAGPLVETVEETND